MTSRTIKSTILFVLLSFTIGVYGNLRVSTKNNSPRLFNATGVFTGGRLTHDRHGRLLTTKEYRRSLSEHERKVIDYWTPERRRDAVAMDLRTMDDPDYKHRRFLQDLQAGKGQAGQGGDDEEIESVDYRWEGGGAMQQASGRIFMVFDENQFSCSGTVVKDMGSPDRTLIATAAHCIYNEMRRYWAHDFLFIPNQDDFGKDESDLKCDNDPFGCWVPAFGVVDTDWARYKNNIPHDYGFLVVPNVGAHKGNGGGEDLAMETTVQAINMDLTDKMNLQQGDMVTAMGLPGYEHNELRYATGNVKIWQNLLFVPGGRLTEGASGGSIVTDAIGDPTLIGFNVFKAGWWRQEPDGDGYEFVQTACGGPPLWGSSFCALAHVAEETPFEDYPDGKGVIYEWDGTPCVIPGICSSDSDCDDGQFCNGVESCVNGQCVLADSGPCSGDERCDEVRDKCMPPCTNDGMCRDGDWCNGDEICQDGQCVSGPPRCGEDTYCDPFKRTCEEIECVEDADCDDGRFCSGQEVCKQGECMGGFDPCDKRGGEVCVEELEACPQANCAGVPDFCLDEYTQVCCHCIKHCNKPFAGTVVMECAPELFWPLPWTGFLNPAMCWTLIYQADENPNKKGFRELSEMFRS